MRLRGLLVPVAVLFVFLAGCGGGDANSLTAGSAAGRLAGAIPYVTKNLKVTQKNDPNDLLGRPGGYVAANVLFDSRSHCEDGPGVDCGATIEQFADESAASARLNYIKALAEGSPLLAAEYDYQRGPLVLRVTDRLRPGEAKKYEQYFMADDAPTVSPSDRAAASPKPAGHIVESGFVQDGEYVQAVALVKNTSGRAGQTVIVNFDFKNRAGKKIKTESQTESFSAPGQELAVVSFADLGSGTPPKIASVHASLLIKDQGGFPTHKKDLGSVPATVTNDGYGNWTAKYKVKNPTAKPLEAPRVGIVCKNARGKIVGVGSDYPAMVPPHGSYLATDAMMTVSGDPSSCTAYIGWPV